MTTSTPTFGPNSISETPLLENGDRLTREEFERRYQAMPKLKKAELIEGEVYMPSPVRWDRHARPNRCVSAWLGLYEASTPGVLGGDNATVRLDLDNEFQPDGLLLLDPVRGGQARISADDYVENGPELVAEVSASSVSIDLSKKLHVYRRNNVQEYLVWRVLDQAVDWFRLRHGTYEALAPRTGGILQSEVFPGLWLDPAALTRFDLAVVLRVLQQGLAGPEHAAFVARLNPLT